MRSVAIAVVLGLFLVSSFAAQAEEMSVLNSVSTSVLGGRTRVVFQFGGDVRFSTEQTKNGVRIVFSRTRAASMQVLNRRVLNAGPLEGIGFQRPAMDSIIAVLAFVHGSTYRCVCPASGNELVVDVNGSAAVRQTSISRPVAAPKAAQAQPATSPVVASNQPASAEPARTATGSSLIDIPAVAKRQMELENSGDSRRTGEPVQYSALMLVIVSVAVSLAVTALAMLFIVRMMRREPAPVAAAPVAPAQVASIAAKVSAYQQKPILPQDEAEEDDDDDMKPEPDRIRALFNAPVREEEPEEDAGRETSLQLARTFRRGSEEITLARKFHERPSPALTPAKMQTAMARATTKSQRLNAARKLGVGRGEFDLAQKLKTMSQQPEKNEEEKA